MNPDQHSPFDNVMLKRWSAFKPSVVDAIIDVIDCAYRIDIIIDLIDR